MAMEEKYIDDKGFIQQGKLPGESFFVWFLPA